MVTFFLFQTAASASMLPEVTVCRVRESDRQIACDSASYFKCYSAKQIRKNVKRILTLRRSAFLHTAASSEHLDNTIEALYGPVSCIFWWLAGFCSSSIGAFFWSSSISESKWMKILHKVGNLKINGGLSFQGNWPLKLLIILVQQQQKFSEGKLYFTS